jgi:hypothetical protein
MSLEHHISVPCLFFPKQQLANPAVGCDLYWGRCPVELGSNLSKDKMNLEHHISVPCLFFPKQQLPNPAVGCDLYWGRCPVELVSNLSKDNDILRSFLTSVFP